jgi:iron complex outermembrane receptor protein
MALHSELQHTPRFAVTRGPGATFWAPNAVNGVVNVVTKNSRDTPGLFMQVGT